MNKKVLWRINFYPFFIFISFLIWCFAFRNFLSGKMALVSDAQAYYEHIKFYIDQIMRGIYPMWDPTYSCGIPNEFFLRRIGSFNPFFSIIIILRMLGMDHLQAYLFFLSAYFFIGMIGFYKVALFVLHDRRLAFLAYLILMFSSLGTRLFDSFILFTFVPMIWFFYFLIAFAKNRKKYLMIGITFAAMILFTTYIPFYFITVFLSFMSFYAVFYFRKLRKICLSILNFIRKHKVFMVCCCFIFFISLCPGVILFQQAKKGEFSLNHRHSTLKTDNSIEVDPEWKKWSLMEDIAYANYSSNIKKFNFAVIYVPVFAYVVFFLGVIVKLNRKLVFLFFWGGFIFLLSSPELTGVHDFLSKHVFYFKYFRNLHFFLWIVLTPVCILFLVEQLKSVFELKPRNRTEKILLLLFITLIHVGVLLWFVQKGQNILSTYIVLILSNIFFLLYFSGAVVLKRFVFLILLLIISVTQSMEVFHYLERNSVKKSWKYRYEHNYLSFRITDESKDSYRPINMKDRRISYQAFTDENEKLNSNYFDTKWVSFLLKNLDREIFDSYRGNSLIVFDHVECLPVREPDLNMIGRSWAEFKNAAFIFDDKCAGKNVQDSLDNIFDKFEIIHKDSSNVIVSKFDVNEVIFKTDMNKERFLVYNDSYYEGWQVFINGKKADLYQANVAFKGIWVPSGKNVVQFKFGYWWQYVLNYGLLILFYCIFIYLIGLWIADVHYVQSLNRLMHKWLKIRV